MSGPRATRGSSSRGRKPGRKQPAPAKAKRPYRRRVKAVPIEDVGVTAGTDAHRSEAEKAAAEHYRSGRRDECQSITRFLRDGAMAIADDPRQDLTLAEMQRRDVQIATLMVFASRIDSFRSNRSRFYEDYAAYPVNADNG